MGTLIAYHGDTKLKTWCVAEMKSHRKSETLRQGYGYWKDGAGCGVGCLIKGSDHALYETKFGIPEMLARLEDTIFEGLPVAKAQKWPERFLSAIQAGQDLSTVGWEFQHRLQINNLKFAKKQKFPDDVITAIEKVINVLEPMSKGKPVNVESADSAESAAMTAWSASAMTAWSAAAYEEMADLLIEIIKAGNKS